MTTPRNIRLNHVRTRSGFDDTKMVIDARSSSVSFEELSEINPTKIESAYDPKRGVLAIITDYGIFEATGFLTQEGLGTGPRGKKGPRGRDGPVGKTGFEGRVGKPGCAGPVGPIGPKGLDGLDVEDGPQGAMGLIGCGGDVGPTGFMGERGPTGPQGPDGSPGSSCLIGETGDIGPTPLEYVVVSNTQPQDVLVYLWAQPFNADVGEIPEEPVVNEPMAGSIPNRTIALSPTAGSFYEGIAAFALTGFSGGVGPFTYKWTGDFETEADVNVAETGTTSTNMNLKCRTLISSGQTVTKAGSVTLTVTDLGDNNTKLILTGTYSFRGTNASSGGGGGGGGGGCIVFGVGINVSNDITVPVQNIMNRDRLIGLDIQGLPDSSYGDNAYMNWCDTKIAGAVVPVNVVTAKRSTYRQYYVINNVLKITLEELVLTYRNNEWSFRRVKDLVVGDELYHITDKATPITSIEIVDAEVSVCSLNVEDIDTYFAEGFLVHNIDGGGFQVKK